jgi:hypothetical protein
VPTFPDLARFEQSRAREPLTLPIKGKTYTFPVDIPADTGLTITRLREEVQAFTLATLAGQRPNPNAELLDDARESTLILDLIGAETWEQMKADGLKWPDIEHAGKTLIAWHVYDEDRALAVWTGGEADPPAEGSSSRPPTTSRRGSTTSSSRSSKRRKRRGSAGPTS